MAAKSLSPENFVRLLTLIAAVIAKQGGQVLVPQQSLALLQKRSVRIKSHNEQSIVFTLLPEKESPQNVTNYSDRVAYRADMVLRHFVTHAPEECLVVTSQEVTALGKFDLNFHIQGQDIVAVVVQNGHVSMSGTADRLFVVEKGVAVLVPLDSMAIDKMSSC